MFGAGTSPDISQLNLDPDGYGVMVNVALNNRCNLTDRCGGRCVLNQVQPEKQELDPETRWEAISEILAAGRLIRFLCLCEKEVFESPDEVFKILQAYHQLPSNMRPQAIGVLSNGLLIKRHIDRLRDNPLDYALVSLDGLKGTHRRGLTMWDPAFANLLELRHRGGTHIAGVNTVVTEDNLDSVISLGRLLVKEGVDYWGLGTYLQPGDDQQMVSSLSPAQTHTIALRLAESLADTDMPAVLEVDPATFTRISGTDINQVTRGPWRLEYPITGTTLRVATVSPIPGRWLRLRFDGQLLDKSDLQHIGVINGRYGVYRPGKLTHMLENIRAKWLSPSFCPNALV